MSVRLDEDTYSKLSERAARFGIAPAVLARAFVHAGLEGEVDLAISPTRPAKWKVSDVQSQPTRSKKSKKRR